VRRKRNNPLGNAPLEQLIIGEAKMDNETTKPKTSTEQGGRVDPFVMCEVKLKAAELAKHMRDNCDGSYVGEECSPMMDILGNRVQLFVAAFWDRSFWFEFKAVIDGTKYSDVVYT